MRNIELVVEHTVPKLVGKKESLMQMKKGAKAPTQDVSLNVLRKYLSEKRKGKQEIRAIDALYI